MALYIVSTFLILLFLNPFGAINSLQLSEHIGDYETLEYNQGHLRDRHFRSRRSAYDKVMKLGFTAFNRRFNLRLHPDKEAFHPEAILEFNGTEQLLDTSHLYRGLVEGHPGSKVIGAITDGVFQGRIVLGTGDSYHVERKEHYGDNKDLSSNSKAHSVIYHDNSVDVEKFYRGIRERRSAAEKETVTDEFCGNSKANVYDWMDRVKRSVVQEEGSSFSHSSGDNPYLRSKRENYYYPYSRKKRATNLHTICNLFLQGDPRLWVYFDEIFTSQASDEQIREEISALFHQHVTAVDAIYRDADFQETNSDVSYRNYGFRVDRVQISKKCDCSTGECKTNSFCSSNIDASNLLNMHSDKNHNGYCLAYLFTYRDFDGGTLGLAWVAEAGKVGGICSTYSKVRDGEITGTRSLNTGIITLNNYRKRVPPRVSYLTFAHELGHNFGSKHDEENRKDSCTPYTDRGSAEGNYIMFASATTGTKSNNDHFSPCSRNSVARVLRAVINEESSKKNCFKEATGAWCGNQILENDGDEGKEVCDCGYTEDCLLGDVDCCRCCIGQDGGNDNADACKLRKDKRCDPSQGPCCNAGCGFKTDGIMCKPQGGCTLVANCTGGAAACPAPDPAPEDTLCNGDTQICRSGKCAASICQLIKTPANGTWFDCEPEKDKNDPTSLCYVSCTPDNATCYNSASVDDSSFPPEFKRLLDTKHKGTKISMPAGHICDQDKGFCDHFQKCRLINGKGPLSRLKDLFFSESTLQVIKEWVTVHWWAVALSILGFIGLMGLFVKFCAVHTPSSNPKRQPARRLAQTLTLRRRQQAQAGAARDLEPRAIPSAPSGEQPPAYSSVITEEPIQSRGRPSNQPRSQQVQSREQRKQEFELQQKNLKKGNRR